MKVLHLFRALLSCFKGDVSHKSGWPQSRRGPKAEGGADEVNFYILLTLLKACQLSVCSHWNQEDIHSLRHFCLHALGIDVESDIRPNYPHKHPQLLHPVQSKAHWTQWLSEELILMPWHWILLTLIQKHDVFIHLESLPQDLINHLRSPQLFSSRESRQGIRLQRWLLLHQRSHPRE